MFRNATIVLISFLFLSSCASGLMQPGDPYDLNWTYQEDERRLNFKDVNIVRQNAKKVIRGTVENVGEDLWPEPTVHFDLLNRRMDVIGTASASRYEELDIGESWEFTVTPRSVSDFYRARYKDPTGW